MTKREDIAAKIRNLRAKASNVASTEAEAQQAALMIAKLLSKHDMTEDDVKEYQEPGTVAVQGSTEGRLHMTLRYCWRGITQLTETDAYLNAQDVLQFIGMEHDVEMALYLSEVIIGASVRAQKAGWPKATTLERNSFYAGFGNSLNEKLKELAKGRKEAKTGTGTAIVVVKNALVNTFKEEAGLALRTRKARSTRVDGGHYQAGQAVGSRMNLNRPLGN